MKTGAHYLSLLLVGAALIVAIITASLFVKWAEAVCYEDMPCWNCATMGNLRCGN